MFPKVVHSYFKFQYIWVKNQLSFTIELIQIIFFTIIFNIFFANKGQIPHETN